MGEENFLQRAKAAVHSIENQFGQGNQADRVRIADSLLTIAAYKE